MSAIEIRELAERANAIVALADREDRELTGDERSRVLGYLDTASKMKKSDQDKASIRDQINGLSHIGFDDSDKGPRKAARFSKMSVRQTPGGLFTASEEYLDLLTQRGTDTAPWNKRRISTDPVGMAGGLVTPRGSNLHIVRNALVTGTSDEAAGDPFGTGESAGVLVRPQDGGFLPTTYARELVLRDLLTVVPVSGDTIDYVRVEAVDNNAAVVPEAQNTTAPADDGDPGPLTSGNPGGYKPESGLTFSQQREHVHTIAHTMPVTKKALADAPQIRVIIDTFLRYGLDEKVEDMIISGTGANSFHGLFSSEQAANGVQTYAGSPGEDKLDKALRAKTKSRLARGGAPTAYVMNPQTWEEYQLTRDGNDNYRGGGPFGNEATPTLWALPVVLSEGVQVGKVITGNFSQAVYYDRQQATVTATDSHGDFFIRNLVMILAEESAGFALLHPSTFVKFDATDNEDSI